ncbi:hypothetical protein Scep_022673 [Stephania cephalantha]|uniref:Uncharacterized protein n=1 Tax=Stephania cephalantha TaxID=152367 RepID=A0AAP0F6M6_9MAGN
MGWAWKAKEAQIQFEAAHVQPMIATIRNSNVKREHWLAFFGTLLLILGFCHCSDKYVEVNGLVECFECSLDNIESAEVLSGHQILISCKVDDEQFETRGIGEVKDGKFKLKSISSDITCPSFDDELEASKVVTQSIENGKHILGTKGKLDLSPNVCNSAFLVHYFLKHPIIKKHYKKRVVTAGGNDRPMEAAAAAAVGARTERRKATSSAQRWRFAPVGEDHQRSEAKRAQPRGRRFGARAAAAAAVHSTTTERRPRVNVPTTGGIRTTEGDGRPILLAPDGRWMRRRSPERRKRKGKQSPSRMLKSPSSRPRDGVNCRKLPIIA